MPPFFAIPFPAIDPVAISFGPFAIRWYALAYIAGLVIGWRYCLALADRPPHLVRRQDIDDFLVWATLGVVLGGRIGYVLFYNPGYYFAHPVQALYVWHGGMSFHGGAIGVTLAIILFTRARRIPLFAFSDIITEAIPIGLFFGRIANFINGELYGRPSDVPWAMIFPNGGPVPRHPSQLYEALCEGILLFVLLFVAERRGARRWPGMVTGIVSRRLRRRPHVRRAVPPARPADRLSDLRHDDGPAVVDPGADRRHRDHPVGAAGSAPFAAVTRGALADKIARRIRAEGPLSVAAYMAMALHDPELGYYATRQPIGAAGDFVTAPEISQIFGELIGLWCALMWERIGRPDPVILAELGPGSGALAADLLRAAAALPEFRRAMRLHLVEASPMLRAEQQRRLAIRRAGLARPGRGPARKARCCSSPTSSSTRLPIRQLVRGPRHWCERMVALDPEGRFAFVAGPENPALSLLVPEALREPPRPARSSSCARRRWRSPRRSAPG